LRCIKSGTQPGRDDRETSPVFPVMPVIVFLLDQNSKVNLDSVDLAGVPDLHLALVKGR